MEVRGTGIRVRIRETNIYMVIQAGLDTMCVCVYIIISTTKSTREESL